MAGEVLRIRGGRPLAGEITVRGAKNFIPKAMVASLLTKERCVLRNVAEIEDVRIVSEMIRLFGGEVFRPEDGILVLQNANLQPPTASPQSLNSLAGRSRIPILFVGPLLQRLGEAFIPGLGGCEIGSRPIDFHLAALRALGAEAMVLPEGVCFQAKRLDGSRIQLPYPSVGATEQVLLAAVKARGTTELFNAAIEPEVIELASLLQEMGANIAIDPNRRMTIVGVEELQGFDFTAPTDRIEVASWACSAVLTGGEIFVRQAEELPLAAFLNKFQEIGGGFTVEREGIRFWRKRSPLATVVQTDVHPGFMTDWQPPLVVLLTQATGVSLVHETVYENRFGYTEALCRMGAKIQLFPECPAGQPCRFGQGNHLHQAVIHGPTKLQAQTIEIPDLRGGFSYLLAALAAEGVSTVKNIQTIGRGYERFLDKLQALNADLIWN